MIKSFIEEENLWANILTTNELSRHPICLYIKKFVRHSEPNQIQISIKEIMTTIKTKLLKEAYLAFKRLFYSRPKLIIMRSIWK